MSNSAAVSPPGEAIDNLARHTRRGTLEDGDGAKPPGEMKAESTPVVLWQPRRGHRYRGRRLVVKRMLDVAGSGLLLVALAPLLMVVFIAVRTTSEGPGLFRQERIGRNGRPFTIIKFRSMQVGAEQRLAEDAQLRQQYLAGGYKLSLDADPRITRLGAFLRRTSLDELPQLWNVFKGEMSLVGPRPVLREELGDYGRYVGAYLIARPGLTGPWQVAGRDAVRFPLRGRFDADYVDNWSLVTDFAILLRTVPSAIRARGVQ